MVRWTCKDSKVDVSKTECHRKCKEVGWDRQYPKAQATQPDAAQLLLPEVDDIEIGAGTPEARSFRFRYIHNQWVGV